MALVQRCRRSVKGFPASAFLLVFIQQFFSNFYAVPVGKVNDAAQ
jgi:hypothetical protein